MSDMRIYINTYKCFSGGESNAVDVHTSDKDSLALDTAGKGLGDLKRLGVGAKLGMRCGRHGSDTVDMTKIR